VSPESIQASGPSPQSFCGCTEHVYIFTSDYSLGAGKRVYIHTGKGTNGSPDYQHRYWSRAWYVWNNTGDTAYVRNPSGTLIDSCSWGSGSYTIVDSDTPCSGKGCSICESQPGGVTEFAARTLPRGAARNASTRIYAHRADGRPGHRSGAAA
jgi:hypothetical protein